MDLSLHDQINAKFRSTTCMTASSGEACRQIQQAVQGAENDTVEGEKYLKLLLQVTKYNLPLHLPEDVWGIMAPSVLYPGQMEEFYTGVSQVAPCTWEMMVCCQLSFLEMTPSFSNIMLCLVCVLPSTRMKFAGERLSSCLNAKVMSKTLKVTTVFSHQTLK
jgi:hypothetical protein